MRATRPRDTRQAVIDAAIVEFAARGFDGATVDVIARRARVNKAMIYYHFGSKIRLYRAIFQETLDVFFKRVSDIAESRLPPEEKLARFVADIMREMEARPDFPRIMVREIADNVARLDADTVRMMARLPQVVGGIIRQGVESERFIPVDPLLAYFSTFGPMMFFIVSAPMRAVLARLKLVDEESLRTEAFITHLQTSVRRSLLASQPGRGARRPTAVRSGEKA